MSTVFVSLNLDMGTIWLQNLSFDLLSKWHLNLELISSSQRQNNNGETQNSKYSLWLLVHINNLTLQFVVCVAVADAVFTNLYLLEQRYCNLFQRSFKRILMSILL